MSDRNGYSKKEQWLINQFGFGYLILHIDVPHILYRMCVEEAFLKKIEGPATESLRRVYQALQSCSHNRHTPEFEALIEND